MGVTGINSFTVKLLWPSQSGTWISTAMSWSVFCSMDWCDRWMFNLLILMSLLIITV